MKQKLLATIKLGVDEIKCKFWYSSNGHNNEFTDFLLIYRILVFIMRDKLALKAVFDFCSIC